MLDETGVNIELPDLPAFLGTLVPLVEQGFSDADVGKVISLAQHMEWNEEREIEFPIVLGSVRTALWFGLFIDSPGEVDLTVATDAALCAQIRERIKAFFEG